MKFSVHKTKDIKRDTLTFNEKQEVVSILSSLEKNGLKEKNPNVAGYIGTNTYIQYLGKGTRTQRLSVFLNEGRIHIYVSDDIETNDLEDTTAYVLVFASEKEMKEKFQELPEMLDRCL